MKVRDAAAGPMVGEVQKIERGAALVRWPNGIQTWVPVRHLEVID